MTTLMSHGQYRELAAGAIKMIPVVLDGAVAQMLIDNPKLFAVYIEEWFGSVPLLQVKSRALDPLKLNIECPSVLDVLRGMERFRKLFPNPSGSAHVAQKILQGWQTEFLRNLHAQDERVRNQTFRPVIVAANANWRMPHMLAHIRSLGLEPALPQHLVHVEVRFGHELKSTKRLVCPTPLHLDFRPCYLSFATRESKTEWELIHDIPTDDRFSWCDYDHVLAIAPA